jgi:hypothetical protein
VIPVVIKLPCEKPFKPEYFLVTLFMIAMVIVSSHPVDSALEIRGLFSRRDDGIYDEAVHVQGRRQYGVVCCLIRAI